MIICMILVGRGIIVMGRIKGSIRILALSVRVVLATPLDGVWSELAPQRVYPFPRFLVIIRIAWHSIGIGISRRVVNPHSSVSQASCLRAFHVGGVSSASVVVVSVNTQFIVLSSSLWRWTILKLRE